jgi:hypothetical protein
MSRHPLFILVSCKWFCGRKEETSDRGFLHCGTGLSSTPVIRAWFFMYLFFLLFWDAIRAAFEDLTYSCSFLPSKRTENREERLE